MIYLNIIRLQFRSGFTNKKTLFYISIVVGILVLLYLMTNTFWAFLFGILIEWKALRNIMQGNIKVNWLFIPAIFLAIVCFIPRLYWSIWFGLANPFYIEMFKMAETQILLTALSGILLVRSFNKH
ncbi:hypothetical protein [Alkalihalobacillus sp. AL-G]|uniref:hypothetical protein n=1 Tax=Alkalihalobacillus sp. AL-G TaxID=2926399 RepID=UPI00272B26E1|nr:hypothetical protein [Alkalihalobacillus sp. AL-G]WLD94492.1 hypothetical protein MOJ78_06290 [Alkalihalobacillus sp. AL-G]